MMMMMMMMTTIIIIIMLIINIYNNNNNNDDDDDDDAVKDICRSQVGEHTCSRLVLLLAVERQTDGGRDALSVT